MTDRFKATHEVIAIFGNSATDNEHKCVAVHKLLNKVFDSAQSEIKNLSRVVSDLQKGENNG